MPQVSVASASLAAAAVESFLYGIFLILAFASIYFHFSRTAASHQDFKRTILALFNPILVGSILITITVTGHWITIVARLFDAFIYFDSGASPSAYYAMLPLPTAVVKTAFLMATLIECDTMLAYRLWILWNYNYVIVIIPALAILGQCVTMIAAMYQQTHFQAGVSDEVFLGTMSHWITAGNACTWVTNIYSSCGIAFRVWSVRQHLRPIGGPNIMNVLVTVVESAMLYLFWTFFFLVAYTTKSNLQYFCIDTFSPIAGIACMLINARVGLGWAQRASPHTSLGLSFPQDSHSVAYTGQSFTMNPVAVTIATSIERDDGEDLGQSQVKVDLCHAA